MRKEKILIYANQPRDSYNPLILYFKDGTTINGYFEIVKNELYIKNKWEFVRLPQPNNKRDIEIIKGVEIKDITEYIVVDKKP